MSATMFRVVLLQVMTVAEMLSPYECVALMISAVTILLELLETDDHRLCHCIHSFGCASHHG